MKRFHFFGSRVFKTGVAIFLTAWICELLGWPPVFAVITAIVTVEPTVSDSIKKGIIRFPASAIGSAYAVLFISLFGNSPITYSLAAVFTIVTCFKLKFQAGLLVATLTSVAMVEVIHSNFLVSFFIRLGTTSIGLLVSTAVNMFIFPPDYRKDIENNITKIRKQSGKLVERLFRDILDNKHGQTIVERNMLNKILKETNRTDLLIRFQKDESKYHPLVENEKAQFKLAQKKMVSLRMLHHHIDTLMRTPIDKLSWSEKDRTIILHAVSDLAESLEKEKSYNLVKHQQDQKEITEIFWEDNEEITKNNEIHPTHFPPELIILYELVSMYDVVENYYKKDETKSRIFHSSE